MGRKCAVPHCYTGYRQCKEKAALYKVPDDDFFLSKWQDAIARDDRPITPKDYVCEKHFRDEDILRRRIIKDVVEEYQRPKLKPDAIPSVFPDWPEFISKMTKKRRKMPTETDGIIDMTKNSDDEESEHIPLESEIELNNEEIEIKSENEELMDNTNQEDEEVKEDEDDPIGPKMYRCNICKYRTQYAHNLRTHKTKHLTGSNAYLHCELCNSYKTKWESVFINHMKTKHGISLTEAIKCNFCNFKTKIEQCLVRHCEMEHCGHATPLETLKCPQLNCEYTADSKYTFDLHTVREHCETTQSHHIDGKIINFSETTRKRGLQSVFHGTNPESSNKKRKDNVKYNCSRCPYKTSTELSLQKHLSKHQFAQHVNSRSTDKVVCFDTESSCSKCSFTCSCDSRLTEHSFSHKNENAESIRESTKSGSSSVNNNNEDDTVRIPNFDLVTIKEDRCSDDALSE